MSLTINVMAVPNMPNMPGMPGMPTVRQVTAARRFIAEHGAPAKAVLGNVGRAGVRLVLVGSDGVLGDLMVANVAVAEALIERVAGLDQAEWDTPLTNAATVTPAHRRKMAGY